MKACLTPLSLHIGWQWLEMTVRSKIQPVQLTTDALVHTVIEHMNFQI